MGSMWPSKMALVIAIVVAGVTATQGAAQTYSRRKAQSLVAEMQDVADSALRTFPKLKEIDDVIRQDCASKSVGRAVDDAFCRCGSATAIAMWLSGADPQMAPRLQTFVDTPGAPASRFLTYQGPELYTPLCTLAVGKPSPR